MSLFIFLVLIVYTIIIGTMIIGFDKVEEIKLQEDSKRLKFTIVIPFRNESENLPLLLASLDRIAYPNTLFEVILVNDDSDDNSIEIIKGFKEKSKINLIVLDNERLSGSPKKDAIDKGIQEAKNEWIITTDADCIVQKYWLDAINTYILSSKKEFIIAPVSISPTTSILERFQALETLILQAITMGSYGLKNPLLSNGANLIYNKSLFHQLKGFEGNNNVASGDDIFLLQKVSERNKNLIGYLKTNKATVFTKAERSLEELFSQKKRWLKKMGVKSNLLSLALGIIIILMNFTFLTFLVFALLESTYIKLLLQIAVVKFGVDFLLLFKSARFFKQEKLLFSFWWISLVYPFYLFVVLFSSYFGPYKWKGRKFSA
ncbi:glycosyltransferase [Aegicerativicinus sediminis]